MAFYTVMTPPPGSGGLRSEIEQARLTRESFSWGAFLFTGLWLLGKRLWLATLVFVLLFAGLIYLRSRFGLHPGALTLSYWAIALFLGFEGNNLVARKLARKGWRLTDVVEARDLPEAERRYFERALTSYPPPPRPATATTAPQPAPPSSSLPIIGLFPEAKGR